MKAWPYSFSTLQDEAEADLLTSSTDKLTYFALTDQMTNVGVIVQS